MSDMEIAKWISLVHGTCIGFCPMHEDCDGTDCDGEWYDWLRQEAEP